MKPCARPINNVGIISISFDDAANVPNIMRQTGNDEV